MEFCDSILDGLELETVSDAEQQLSSLPVEVLLQRPGVVLEVLDDDGDIDPEGAVLAHSPEMIFEGQTGAYVDDISGQPLEAAAVHAGRREELVGFSKRGVYEIRDRSWAVANRVPVLGTRWVDKRKRNSRRPKPPTLNP